MAGATKLNLLRRRLFAIFGSAMFLLVAPGSVAGFVPWWISQWRMLPPLFGLEPLRGIGTGLILVSVPALVEAFARFAWQGLGTPAPTFPTQRLVVSGLYRHVRNPMYCAILGVILGQGLLFGDARLFLYAALVWFSFHLFVVEYEEPKLQRTYGEDYAAFRAAVPRWIPRFQAWRGKASSARNS
jgi:protein-S-isoprenylcysteine O-methyltransferase Ste14